MTPNESVGSIQSDKKPSKMISKGSEESNIKCDSTKKVLSKALSETDESSPIKSKMIEDAILELLTEQNTRKPKRKLQRNENASESPKSLKVLKKPIKLKESFTESSRKTESGTKTCKKNQCSLTPSMIEELLTEDLGSKKPRRKRKNTRIPQNDSSSLSCLSDEIAAKAHKSNKKPKKESKNEEKATLATLADQRVRRRRKIEPSSNIPLEVDESLIMAILANERTRKTRKTLENATTLGKKGQTNATLIKKDPSKAKPLATNQSNVRLQKTDPNLKRLRKIEQNLVKFTDASSTTPFTSGNLTKKSDPSDNVMLDFSHRKASQKSVKKKPTTLENQATTSKKKFRKKSPTNVKKDEDLENIDPLSSIISPEEMQIIEDSMEYYKFVIPVTMKAFFNMYNMIIQKQRQAAIEMELFKSRAESAIESSEQKALEDIIENRMEKINKCNVKFNKLNSRIKSILGGFQEFADNLNGFLVNRFS